ncbi:hypothetical protein BGLA2_610027 [Burkholderia gladioli]|nr:hypothetical protein BGLA2_610027 [Burkholderia gladioli]
MGVPYSFFRRTYRRASEGSRDPVRDLMHEACHVGGNPRESRIAPGRRPSQLGAYKTPK